MTLSRWKLMAGVIGLGMCGLAALAEPACRTVGLTRRADDPKPDEPKPTEAAKPLPLPDAPLPTPPATTEVPPPVILPVTDSKPPVPAALPVPMPAKNDPKTPPVMDPKAFEDVTKALQPTPVPLPTLPTPTTPPPATTPPAPKFDFHTTAPVPVTPPVPVATPVVPVKGEVPAPPEAKVDVAPLAKPDTVPAEAKAAPFNGKQLKVMLHLSTEKPWFEVKDGDELVLRVTAESVNLMAAADAGKPAVLTAAGGVSFRTLGQSGTCDEVQVMPGTGEVVVKGKVTVTSNWGKAETTATAEKMTFRLGGEAKK